MKRINIFHCSCHTEVFLYKFYKWLFYSFQIQNAFLHQADILWRARPRRNFPFDSRICWGRLWRWEAHWSTCCCYNIYLRWDNQFSGEQFSALKPSLTYGQVASFNLYVNRFHHHLSTTINKYNILTSDCENGRFPCSQWTAHHWHSRWQSPGEALDSSRSR